jgi:outer membrane immunogenic protein
MKAFFLRLALVSTVMVPVTSALAADLDPPPPVDDLRPATYDWSGVHVGVFAAANALDGHYDATRDCDDPLTVPVETCPLIDPEMSGIGYGFGAKIGADYQFDNLVVGVVGDWTFGGDLATNDDPSEATYLNMNNLATARLRAGYANGDTLLYVTGGIAAADIEFGALVGPTSVDDSQSEWTYGWAIGGGIEHAVTESLSLNLEYLYIDLADTEHYLSDGAGNAGTIDMYYNDMHTVRAGMSYRFSL